MSKSFGDFQTPSILVEQVLHILAQQNKPWTRLLEPTCGKGHFITGVLNHPTFDIQEAHGVEIQAQYVERLNLPKTVHITHADIFLLDTAHDLMWQTEGDLLVLGNPPWVTNADIHGDNYPPKNNLKGLVGLDAVTGASNFDIAESIILKLMLELQSQNPTIAMLCKTTVARNILQFAAQSNLPIEQMMMWRIDAKQAFGVSVDACLLYIDMQSNCHHYEMTVYASLNAVIPETIIGVNYGKLIADVSHHTQMFDGKSPVVWRQGVKHDAASVMELTYQNNGWVNKLGNVVDIESEHIFPLCKSSDLFHDRTQSFNKGVIITQKTLGQDTTPLADTAPKLWSYLQQHQQIFDKRKSSIYRNRPAFSMFGIGDYTFAPYKVAISGLHKQFRFRLLQPIQGKPAIVDDTSYFIPCNTFEQAALLTVILNHAITQDFLNVIVFKDAKRPITKKRLQRLDLTAILAHIGEQNTLQSAMALSDKIHLSLSLDDFEQVLAKVFLPYSTTPLLL